MIILMKSFLIVIFRATSIKSEVTKHSLITAVFSLLKCVSSMSIYIIIISVIIFTIIIIIIIIIIDIIILLLLSLYYYLFIISL